MAGFTTFSALKIAILDAIADSVAGSPCTGEYQIGGRTMKYRSYEELMSLYKEVSVLAAKESGPRSSFGRYRRFR
jgi:hypothetical protein